MKPETAAHLKVKLCLSVISRLELWWYPVNQSRIDYFDYYANSMKFCQIVLIKYFKIIRIFSKHQNKSTQALLKDTSGNTGETILLLFLIAIPWMKWPKQWTGPTKKSIALVYITPPCHRAPLLFRKHVTEPHCCTGRHIWLTHML